MPTEEKIKAVDEMRQWMENCTVAISTDYTGLAVGQMTELRRVLRAKGVQYRVVKNTLAHLAADAATKPAMKDIVQGPTGIAFGFGDPTESAKALSEFIRSSRSPLTIRGGVMGDRGLTAREVGTLAMLPSKEELIANLLGRLQGPVAGLVYVLNAPISGLARVLQRQVEKME